MQRGKDKRHPQRTGQGLARLSFPLCACCCGVRDGFVLSVTAEKSDCGGGSVKRTLQQTNICLTFCIIHFLTTPVIKKKLISQKQGLGQLLIGAPRLMLLADKHGVVGAALAKGAGDEVLVQALR